MKYRLSSFLVLDGVATADSGMVVTLCPLCRNSSLTNDIFKQLSICWLRLLLSKSGIFLLHIGQRTEFKSTPPLGSGSFSGATCSVFTCFEGCSSWGLLEADSLTG
jgi:hypothetical protein